MSSAEIFKGKTGDGDYGISTLLGVTNLANSIYDLYERVIGDDGKITLEDASDFLVLGPGLFRGASEVAKGADQLGKEVTDLSEGEKARLLSAAGTRLKNPSYLKIYDGVLNIIDGLAELAKESNPVD